MKLKSHYSFHGAHHFLGVTFPDGNKKQDRLLSIAMSPKHTCPKGAPCRKENGGSCYYQAEEGYHPSVAVSAQHNWEVWKTDPVRFWNACDKALKYCAEQKIGFRWFEGGDIPSYDFFCEIMKRAQKYPGMMHGMTKRYAFVNRYIKEHGGDKDCVLRFYNLRYSRWTGYPMANPYGMPEFALTFDESGTTCLEQRLKMLGKEWSCRDCYNYHVGCYRPDHATIKCIDHKTEGSIIRKRKLWMNKIAKGE